MDTEVEKLITGWFERARKSNRRALDGGRSTIAHLRLRPTAWKTRVKKKRSTRLQAQRRRPLLTF